MSVGQPHGWLPVLALIAAAAAVPAAAADPAAGRRLAVACATCHGEHGIAVVPETPHLAGQPASYLAKELRSYRSGKRPHEVMAVVAKPLSDADIDDLAAWFASVGITALPPR
jgi:cytochrome c553